MKINNFFKNLIKLGFITATLCASFFIQAQNLEHVQIATQLTKNTFRAGDVVPVQVSLIDFGTPNETVDVTLNYFLEDDNKKQIVTFSETLALATSGSFLRNFTLPHDLSPGLYHIRVDATYKSQIYEAVSHINFNIEPYFLGYPLSMWVNYWYYFPLSLLFIFIFHRVLKRRQKIFVVDRDYSHIQEQDRVYYEIIHDIIDALRYEVGLRDTQQYVREVSGIDMSEDFSHIEKLTESPGILISSLLQVYESVSTRKLNIITSPHYTGKRVI